MQLPRTHGGERAEVFKHLWPFWGRGEVGMVAGLDSLESEQLLCPLYRVSLKRAAG